MNVLVRRNRPSAKQWTTASFDWEECRRDEVASRKFSRVMYPEMKKQLARDVTTNPDLIVDRSSTSILPRSLRIASGIR